MTTFPVINPNGTVPLELLDQQLLAINALRIAISTLESAAPNDGDYQTAPGAFSHAQVEHAERLKLLEFVVDELEQIAEHISDHVLAQGMT